jgi:hypothetical protein
MAVVVNGLAGLLIVKFLHYLLDTASVGLSTFLNLSCTKLNVMVPLVLLHYAHHLPFLIENHNRDKIPGSKEGDTYSQIRDQAT